MQHNTYPLGMQLGRLAGLQARQALQLLNETLDISVCGILLKIGSNGATGQQEIGERLGIERSTVMRLMRELETLELVERLRRPENLRQIELVLTSKGLELLDRVKAAMVESQTMLLADLSPSERSEYLRVSSAVISAAPFRFQA